MIRQTMTHASRPNFRSKPDLWALWRIPIKVARLKNLLVSYPNRQDAAFLSDGLSLGFNVQFEGPRVPIECNNSKSIVNNPVVAEKNITSEFASATFLKWLVVDRCSKYVNHYLDNFFFVALLKQTIFDVTFSRYL